MVIFTGNQDTPTARIHKKPLLKAGEKFEEMIQNVDGLGQIIDFRPNVEPQVFKRFMNYIYNEQVPSFNLNSAHEVKTTAIKNMIDLYAFAEKYEVCTEYRNKLIDIIQDGFSSIDSPSKAGIVSRIYKATKPYSQIRKLTSLFLVHYLRSPSYVEDGKFQLFLTNTPGALDDFLEAIRSFESGQDPRIRDCGGDMNCLECYTNPYHRKEGVKGVHPCTFHVHRYTGPFKEMKLKVINGVQVLEDDDFHDQREKCHLWKN